MVPDYGFSRRHEVVHLCSNGASHARLVLNRALIGGFLEGRFQGVLIRIWGWVIVGLTGCHWILRLGTLLGGRVDWFQVGRLHGLHVVLLRLVRFIFVFV